jgi:hypothetical protein
MGKVEMDFLNLLLLENLICQIINVGQDFSDFRFLFELVDPNLEEAIRYFMACTQYKIVLASEITDSQLDLVYRFWFIGTLLLPIKNDIIEE